MPTMNATPAPAAFYAGLPYLIRLALACEESEAFLETDAFLSANDAEEALARHLEFDHALADKYGLGDPDAIWRAFAARDIGCTLRKLSYLRCRMAMALVLAALLFGGEAHAFGYDPKWTHCQGQDCPQHQEQAKPASHPRT